MAFQIRRIQKFPAPQKARWTLDKVLVNFIRFHPDYRGLQAKQRGTKVSEASLKKKGRKQCAISPREISLEECWRWDSTVESSILSARIGNRIQLLIETVYRRVDFREVQTWNFETAGSSGSKAEIPKSLHSSQGEVTNFKLPTSSSLSVLKYD